MKVAITQPNFLPWFGYFDLLQSVDVFVVLDCVQLVKRSFMTRNRILDSMKRVAWIVEHIKKCAQKTMMNKSYMANDQWSINLIQKIKEAYKNHPGGYHLISFLDDVLHPRDNEIVSEYNWRLLMNLFDYFNLRKPNNIIKASSIIDNMQFKSPQELILYLCKETGATSFYNFKKGVESGFYKHQAFKEFGIKLFKQEYIHPTYKQYTKQDFVPYLSIIDLGFCEPNNVSTIVQMGSNWIEVIENKYSDDQ
ncbi:MAG: WbqC family protein [Nitrospirae bacterium]|nr:WbqC family protein [Nitrospirota bacterium]